MSAEKITSLLSICQRHAERLQWAMSQLSHLQPFDPERLEKVDDTTMAIMDQFASRFSKLQDVMGAQLLPAVLDLTAEQGELTTFIDKLNRLEKMGAIHSTERWMMLREMRNQFAHDYPEEPEIQASLLDKAFTQSRLLLDEFERVRSFINRYLPSTAATS